MSTKALQPERTKQGMSGGLTASRLMLLVLLALAGLLVALAGALIYAPFALGGPPPTKDVQDMVRFLLGSGAISVALGALGFRVGLGTRIPSLAITIAFVYLVGAAIVGINVLYTALNMFLSSHDFGLLTILLVFSSVISLFFAFFLSQSIVSRLRGLLALSRRVADGDLTARVDGSSNDEIGQLAHQFNSMVDKLQQSYEERERLEVSRRELIAAVSHDLRTPLASMRAMVEALNDGVVSDPETINRYLGNIQHETKHLSTLIDDLFELSQIDAGVLKLHLELTSIEDLVSDVLESMSAQAEKKGIKLHGQVEGSPTRVQLDAPRIQRVLYNLIQNALRHTPTDGTVVLTVRGERDKVELMVADSGEGIAPGDLPHIFDRFYRGEPARTRSNRADTPGVGLGLAISRGIVEAHGGTIDAVSGPGQGATFHVVLPTSADRLQAVSLGS
ncbi:MAG TPA: HAMP domain-containing sensor histidine kinase [Chloroflexia bacterium]|nr:HAMP domain-containing sensor histidine kinase [Chloroflexia bacterium]